MESEEEFVRDPIGEIRSGGIAGGRYKLFHLLSELSSTEQLSDRRLLRLVADSGRGGGFEPAVISD